MRRCLAVIATLVASFVAVAVSAQDEPLVYRTVVLVTGTLAQERQRGFAEALERVLVKVSGDPSVAREDELAALKKRAGDLVETFSYRDRLAGIPVHDEQGTRERPRFLTVDFNPGKLDALLVRFGRKPWVDRPPLFIKVTVDNGSQRFVLTNEAVQGRDHRDALEEQAAQAGLRMLLVADASAQRPFLGGTLQWDAVRRAWFADWLLQDDEDHRWTHSAQSFDVVFRQSFERTVGVLSKSKR